MRVRVVALLAVAVLLAGTPPARAGATIGTSMTVDDAVPSECDAGRSTWTVSGIAQVDNLRDHQRVYEQTDFDAEYDAGGDTVFVRDVTVIDHGGFVAGTTVAGGDSNDHSVVVSVSMPCDVEAARIFADVKVQDDDRIYASGDHFVVDGTPVPLGAIGGLTAAIAIGGILVASTWRRSRPAVATMERVRP